MKKIYILALMAAIILSGCSKEPKPEVNSDGEKVLVHLNLSGEIDVEDSPLTKAFTSDDLIGVQVYQGSDYYAYGLFDDVSKMNIYLHTGKIYKFVCTVVKNGKSLVHNSGGANVKIVLPGFTSSVVVFLEPGEYSLPFIDNTPHRYTPSGSVYSYQYDYTTAPLDNSFVYSREEHFLCLQYGTIATGREEFIRYPKADRFYGEVSGFTPSNGDALSIPMTRVSFGVSLSVAGITDGNVTVTIKNSEQTLHTNAGITQDTQFGTTTWSFFDLKSAWQYADNYAENFIVGVVWNRGVGVTQDLGTKTVQFKRNAVNHVKINLSTSTKSAGIAVSLEVPEITNETYSFGN